MTLFIIGIILIVGAIGVGIWRFRILMAPAGCNPPLPTKGISLGAAKFTVEMATTAAEQTCGLSGREGLALGHGMLFIFGAPSIQSFWMKDMAFPIDIIWIAKGKVAGFAQNADPQVGVPLWKLKIYFSPPGVDTVLEVPSGTVAQESIKVGDNFEYTD